MELKPQVTFMAQDMTNAYFKPMIHVCLKNMCDQLGLLTVVDRKDQIDLINQVLHPFHGRVHTFGFPHIIFAFDSESDLTQFVLTWS